MLYGNLCRNVRQSRGDWVQLYPHPPEVVVEHLSGFCRNYRRGFLTIALKVVHPKPAPSSKVVLHGVHVAVTSVFRRLSLIIQLVLVVQVAIALFRQQWAVGFFTLVIALMALVPTVLERRFHVYIPSKFQLLTIFIVFAAFFLGEVQDYYNRFWWWDIALHGTTGFLMGIVGFLMIYVFSRLEPSGLRLQSSAVALLAFMFALGAGAIWEVGEFLLDRYLGTNLQKPTPADPSGLTDTMIDLIVDAAGALLIALYGYWHLKFGHRQSFLQRWTARILSRNAHFLRRDKPAHQVRR